jgi:hypothetical protein
MAAITLQATGVTQRSKTISAGDLTRVLNAYKTIAGQVPDVTPGTFRDRTNQEVFDWFADKLIDRIKEDVRNIERDTAAAAIAAVVLT